MDIIWNIFLPTFAYTKASASGYAISDLVKNAHSAEDTASNSACKGQQRK